MLWRNPFQDEERSSGTSGIDATDHEIALALKSRAGLIVNPGYQFGALGSDHFRICVAQEESAWKDALERMAAVLAMFPLC